MGGSGGVAGHPRLTEVTTNPSPPPPQASPTGPERVTRWLKKYWTWLAALLASVAGLVWLIGFPPLVCGSQLGGKDTDTAIQICRPVQLTDPVVIAWAVIVLLLLWGSLSEGSIAGLFSFKRQVDQAVSDSKQAKETAERALLQVSQSNTTTVNVSSGVPGPEWRDEDTAPAGTTGARASASPENRVLRKLAELAISTILRHLIEAAGLDPHTTSAHIYTYAVGQLTRADTPIETRSRAWPVGSGAVGKAWEQRGYAVQTRGEPDFIDNPDYFISAVAAIPVLNAAGRPIGVISLHSRAQDPPDLNSDQVFGAMVDAAELMGRVYVNLATWETDSATAADG